MPPEAAGACDPHAGPAVFLSPNRGSASHNRTTLSQTQARTSRKAVARGPVTLKPIAKRDEPSAFARFAWSAFGLAIVCLLIFAALTWPHWGHYWRVLRGVEPPAWKQTTIGVATDRDAVHGTEAGSPLQAGHITHTLEPGPQQAPSPRPTPRRRGGLSALQIGGVA